MINAAKAWWSNQSPSGQLAIALAGAATIGLLAYTLIPEPKRFSPNLRRTKGYRRAKPARVRGKRSKASPGRIITLDSGTRFGHTVPPKRYWEMGAKKKSDYAWPTGYKYPLVFRSGGKINRSRTVAHIKSAKSFFSRSKKRYPPTVRRAIARNINKASRRFGVGGKVVKA